MPGLVLRRGFGNRFSRRHGAPFPGGAGTSGPSNPITGTGPVLAALTDGDTLSRAVTWGSYEPEGAEATQQMRVDGGEWVDFDGDTEVVAGEVWEVREVVAYEGFTRTFTGEAVTVGAATITLGTLILSTTTVSEDAEIGDTVGTVSGMTTGSTLTLQDDGDGAFELDGSVLKVAEALSEGTISIILRETLDGAANSPRDTEIDIEVEGVWPELFTARWGAGQGIGSSPFDTKLYPWFALASGTYGPFTVADKVITPNTTLTAGTYDVGGYPVEVITNWKAVANQTEWGTLATGDRGKTVLVREGAGIIWENSTSGFLRRQDALGTVILGDGPRVRDNIWDTGLDARLHFNKIAVRSLRNLRVTNNRFAPPTKATCFQTVETSGGGITLGNIMFDNNLVVASRADPQGNYTGGISSFPGNYGFYTSGGSVCEGLMVKDNTFIGALISANISASGWLEFLGNSSYYSYEDHYKFAELHCPAIYGGNFKCGNLSMGSDLANPHGDGLQCLGGSGLRPNFVVEASAFFDSHGRGSGFAQPFFFRGANDGYRTLYRDLVSVSLYASPFSIMVTGGSRMEHMAWAPMDTDTLPSTKGGVRLGYDPVAAVDLYNTNELKNSLVFVGGTVHADVIRSGNFQPTGYTKTDWEATYENFNLNQLDTPTLQEFLAAYTVKTTAAAFGTGHRVTFNGPEDSDYVIDGIEAPTLSSLTVTSTSASAAAATIATDTDLNPVYWAVVPKDTAVSSPRDIKYRKVPGAVLYGFTILGCNVFSATLDLTGSLVAATQYDVVAFQENGWTKVSSVSRATFTAT